MNGRGHVVAAVLLLLLGAQSALAQTGSCLPEQSTLDPSEFRAFFEGPLGGGTSVTGVTGFTGWVIAVNGVQSVQLLVDGVAAMDMLLRTARPGISDLFPGFPDGDNVGFGALLDTRPLHQRRARRERAGHRQRRAPDSAQRPQARVHQQHASAGSVRRSRVAARERQPDRALRRRRSRPPRHRVRRLRARHRRRDRPSRRRFRRAPGRRRDLQEHAARLQPQRPRRRPRRLLRLHAPPRHRVLPDPARHAELRLPLHPRHRRPHHQQGLSRGHHDIIIRAGDISGQVANIDEIPVNFFCLEDFTNFDSIGDIEIGDGTGPGRRHRQRPRLGARLRRRQRGPDPDRRRVPANASYGFPRPGVTMLYPSFPDSLAPGWAYLLDTTTLTNGDHTVGVEVQDEIGTRTFIGERHFTVFNPVH